MPGNRDTPLAPSLTKSVCAPHSSAHLPAGRGRYLRRQRPRSQHLPQAASECEHGSSGARRTSRTTAAGAGIALSPLPGALACWVRLCTSPFPSVVSTPTLCSAFVLQNSGSDVRGDVAMSRTLSSVEFHTLGHHFKSPGVLTLQNVEPGVYVRGCFKISGWGDLGHEPGAFTFTAEYSSVDTKHGLGGSE